MNGIYDIKIGEQDIRLRFGYPCFKQWTIACADNEEFLYLDGVEGSAKLIQCAYNNECLVKEVKPELKYEYFYNWVEQNVNDGTGQVVSDVLNAWTESIATKKSLEKIEKMADEKKNLMQAV